MNSKAHYVVVSNDAVNTALCAVLDKSIDVKYIKEFDFKETDMKFDCIIMNPPYTKNLHLKILAEAIKHLKDENSICVNLSPDTWLHDFADVLSRSDYKKYSSIPFKSITHVGLLNKFFDLGHTTYTGAIYVCGIHGKYDLTKSLHRDIITGNIILLASINKMLKTKLINFIVDSKHSLEGNIKTGDVDEKTKYTRMIPRLVGNPGYRCSCLASIGSKRWDKTFYQGKYNGITMGDTKKKLSNVSNYSSFDYLEFDSEIEAINWRNSCATSFMRYICTLVHVDSHRHAQWIPWMGDSINPRTGKKGYESEWTNEDFCKFFNITPEEQKVIEETMEKYAAK